MHSPLPYMVVQSSMGYQRVLLSFVRKSSLMSSPSGKRYVVGSPEKTGIYAGVAQ